MNKLTPQIAKWFIGYVDRQILRHSGLKVLPEDPLEKISIGFFVINCLIVSVLTSFFGLAYLANGFPKMMAPQLAIAAVAQVCLYIFRRTQSVILAGNVLLTVIFLASWYRVQSFGGIQAPTFYTYTLIPVFAISFLPFSWAFFWTSLFVCLALFYHLLFRLGFGPEYTLSADSAARIRIWGIFFANFAALIWLYFFKRLSAEYQSRLKELSHSKASLLRILSHDVSSPLMVVDFHLQRLAKKSDDPNLEKMDRGLNMIRDILQNVREIEAIQSGKKTFRRELISIGKMAAEISFIFEALLAKKSQRLEILISPELEEQSFYADHTILLHQVISNIISNASKYSPVNAIIKVHFYVQDNDCVIEISDRGIGIPTAILENIFKLDSPTTRPGTLNEAGTGFGMPIAKLCMDGMDGKIEIHSNEGDFAGTLIRLLLPRDLNVIRAID